MLRSGQKMRPMVSSWFRNNETRRVNRGRFSGQRRKLANKIIAAQHPCLYLGCALIRSLRSSMRRYRLSVLLLALVMLSMFASTQVFDNSVPSYANDGSLQLPAD